LIDLSTGISLPLSKRALSWNLGKPGVPLRYISVLTGGTIRKEGTRVLRAASEDISSRKTHCERTTMRMDKKTGREVRRKCWGEGIMTVFRVLGLAVL
jgi:hypothetical protein